MLLKLFSNNKNNTTHLEYTTDLHSHLIPGIDDGVKTLEESIEIISAMEDFGFRKIITTPHIMNHRYKNTKESILDACQKVNTELKKQDINIELQAGAEYFYDENFLTLIEENDLLSFGNSYILFELSYTHQPFSLEDTIFKLLSAGYNPILAHPERYSFLYNNLERYEKLKDRGIKFQINLNSLLGFYGKRPKEAAKYLLNQGFVDFVGSDIHDIKYLDSIKKGINSSLIKKLFKENNILNNTL